MPSLDNNPLHLARAAMGDAAQDRIRKLSLLASARGELEQLTRKRGPNDPEVRRANQEYADARAALIEARALEREANVTLRQWLAELPDPGEAIGALNSEYPILLFPVRIETRFIRFDDPIMRPYLPPQVGELRVRIYPDGILSDSHEPLLSAVELEAGRAYWTTAWRNAAHEDAWTALVAEVGATRASWIVRQCEPANVVAFPRTQAAARTAPPPEFPAREPRPPTWHRAPVARLLPDRWLIQAYPTIGLTNEEFLRYRVLTRPVLEPLTLTLSFTADGVIDDRTELADGLKVNRDIHWTFDFQQAEEVGMAARIPLTDRDFQDGFSRVVVLGVKASLGPQQTAEQLEELFEHHRISRGLAFVPQGTPTNNTADAVSGYPPPDPRASESFRVERGQPLARSGGDGARFMGALGLPAQAANHVAGADGYEQDRARAMATALWPATMGYYMKQMLVSRLDVPDQPADLSAETIEALRRHFIDFVRGRGPFPAFRIGDIPYGLLPVSLPEPSVNVDHEPATGLDATMRVLLSDLAARLSWLAREYAPRVNRTNDPDADLLETFRMDASAREVYVRPAVGEESINNIAEFVDIDAKGIHEPISLDAPPIDIGFIGPVGPSGPEGPLTQGITLKKLLAFDASEPNVVAEHPLTDVLTDRGVPDG